MNFWLDIASFALKAVLIVGSFGALVVVVARVTRGEASPGKGLEIKDINSAYDAAGAQLERAFLRPAQVKNFDKAAKKKAKAALSANHDKRLFVLDFQGDLQASAVKRLAGEIDAVLMIARAGADEVLVKLASPGGTVPGYGLGAMQLLRLRDHKVHLTVCVDQVAASGGYLMACVANRLIAAPFAVLGSIGVVAQVPNLNRLLKKNDIDFEEITAGEFKRSVSLLGEITPAGREHFREKLDTTHVAFKEFVGTYRPSLDLGKVGNGDYWYGREALALGLVDELMTSDAYLFAARANAQIYKISTNGQKSRLAQLVGRFTSSANKSIANLLGLDLPL